jgi:elongation factor Ts
MVVDINLIKQLRLQTAAGIADCREALEQTGGDMEKARECLRKKGLEKADKKSEREIRSGQVFAYIHGAVNKDQGGRVGALVELGCETDFVAKTEDFQTLGKEIAMQVASMDPENREMLLTQSYIRDSKMSIRDLIKERIAKLGENIEIIRFSRFGIG